MQWRPDQIMIPLRHMKSVKSLQWLYGFWLFESFNECNISYWLVVTSRRLLIWTCSSRCFPKSMICSCNWIAYSPDISKFFVKPQSFSARKPSRKKNKKAQGASTVPFWPILRTTSLMASGPRPRPVVRMETITVLVNVSLAFFDILPMVVLFCGVATAIKITHQLCWNNASGNVPVTRSKTSFGRLCIQNRR